MRAARSPDRTQTTAGAISHRRPDRTYSTPSWCEPPWGDFPAATVTRDPVATIRELKEQSGKDIWLWGSLNLMHSLLNAGLVDEVRMLVSPASRGKGTRIFEDSQDLKPVEATLFENGVVLLRYEIKK